jgi:hypothetical protein
MINAFGNETGHAAKAEEGDDSIPLNGPVGGCSRTSERQHRKKGRWAIDCWVTRPLVPETDGSGMQEAYCSKPAVCNRAPTEKARKGKKVPWISAISLAFASASLRGSLTRALDEGRLVVVTTQSTAVIGAASSSRGMQRASESGASHVPYCAMASSRKSKREDLLALA